MLGVVDKSSRPAQAKLVSPHLKRLSLLWWFKLVFLAVWEVEVGGLKLTGTKSQDSIKHKLKKDWGVGQAA
jgi:hypothetical protein